jgi:replicative DNA helicase
MFYYPVNEHVMQAITNVYNDKKPVDIVTVTTEMRKMGEASNIGVFLADLSSTVITDINVATYGQEILEKYACRSAIERSMEIQQAAYDSNLDDVLIKSAEMEDTLLNNLSAVNAVDINAIFAENSRVIEERSKGENRNFIDCGIRAIDRVLGGFEPGNLIVIGGRPGMGKTAFALQLAYNISDFHPVLYFTLEMTREEIGNRYLVMLTDIDGNRLKRGEGITGQEWRLIDEAGKKLKDRKLIIDDTSHLSIYNMRSKIFRLVRSNGVKLVVIDYLQLMEGQKGKDGAEYYGTISRTCKQVAKELKITIILLSQLNRDVERRGEKIPRLYDLRASGEIEQDADVVIFPVRCGFAGINDPAQGLDDTKAVIVIAKNRHGRIADDTGHNIKINVSPNAAVWWDENDIFMGPTTPVAQSWLKDD